MLQAEWTETKTDTGQVVWSASYLGHPLRCFGMGELGWTATIRSETWDLGVRVDTAENAKAVAEVLGRMAPGFMVALAVVTHDMDEKAEAKAKESNMVGV